MNICNKGIQNHRIVKISNPDLSPDFVYYYSSTFAPFFSPDKYELYVQNFPLILLLWKKRKKKNILAQFFPWAPQFVQSTYYVKMRGWLAREYINKRRIKYALNKDIIFPDGVSVQKWVEKLCETSWTVNWANCNKRENRDKFLRFFNW